MRERKSFPSLKLSKKVKERKNICGTHVGNLSTHMWRESLRNTSVVFKISKMPQLLFIFIHFTISFLFFFQFMPNFFLKKNNSLLNCLLVDTNVLCHFIFSLNYKQLFILTYYFCLRVFMSITRCRSFFPPTFYSTFSCTKQPKQSSRFLLFFFL